MPKEIILTDDGLLSALRSRIADLLPLISNALGVGVENVSLELTSGGLCAVFRKRLAKFLPEITIRAEIQARLSKQKRTLFLNLKQMRAGVLPLNFRADKLMAKLKERFAQNENVRFKGDFVQLGYDALASMFLEFPKFGNILDFKMYKGRWEFLVEEVERHPADNDVEDDRDAYEKSRKKQWLFRSAIWVVASFALGMMIWISFFLMPSARDRMACLGRWESLLWIVVGTLVGKCLWAFVAMMFVLPKFLNGRYMAKDRYGFDKTLMITTKKFLKLLSREAKKLEFKVFDWFFDICAWPVVRLFHVLHPVKKKTPVEGMSESDDEEISNPEVDEALRFSSGCEMVDSPEACDTEGSPCESKVEGVADETAVQDATKRKTHSLWKKVGVGLASVCALTAATLIFKAKQKHGEKKK